MRAPTPHPPTPFRERGSSNFNRLPLSRNGVGGWGVGAIAALLLILSPVHAADPPARVAEDLRVAAAPANTLFLDTLDLSAVTTEGRGIVPGKSSFHLPISLSEVTYAHGIGVQGNSEMTVDLKGVATRFEAMVGIDDVVNENGSVDFTVRVDGRAVFHSGPMHGQDPAKLISIDLTGARRLTLSVAHVANKDEAGGDTAVRVVRRGGMNPNTRTDVADWAGALVRLMPGAEVRPATTTLPPIAQAPTYVPDGPAPQVHGPRVVGFSPGHPFAYAIPVSGQAPLTFGATGLPPGITLDARTGLLHGTVASASRSIVTLTVRNAKGAATSELTLVCGDHDRALTPPMGWNAFGVYGDTVSDAQIRAAADHLVSTGLAAHGYRYVCLGDAWEGTRDDAGNLRPNRRFPDMRALADYVHAKGLRFGLYSAATPQTCSGYPGSPGHEAQDARTFASWGVDYLTYDWCPDAGAAPSTTNAAPSPLPPMNAAEMEPAFARMGEALSKSGRDIVFAASVQKTQRYMSEFDDPVEWAAKAGADTFTLSSGLFDSDKIIRDYASERARFSGRAGDGHWADLGLLMVGRIGFPKPHLTRLTPPEQMTQMTLWAMYASPLFVSCDLAHLNPNDLNHDTYALLANDEVIAVDQDPAGHPVRVLGGDGTRTIWTRSLADGRVAVALFNGAGTSQNVRIRLADLDMTGAQPVRDLWRLRDLPPVSDAFETQVAGHGVAFVVVGRGGNAVAK